MTDEGAVHAQRLASIVIAAYNRADVLAFSIRSLLRQTLEDWELIVVGDGCTDDTEAVVRGFDDPRIQFHNLPWNSGGQSSPNNFGLARAQGRWLFLLNQDDLWFDDHLASSIAFLERSCADLIWSPVLLVDHSGKDEGLPDTATDVISFDGLAKKGRFDPRRFVIASSWAMRRGVVRAVGPWREAAKTMLSPSQEWLYRAHRKGVTMAFHSHASVVCIHAAQRRGSYLQRRSIEHERAWSWIVEGETARQALLRCAWAQQRRLDAQLERNMIEGRGRVDLRAAAVALLSRFGIHPIAMERRIQGLSKGEWIARARELVSFASPLTPGARLEAGDPASDAFFGHGWHEREPTGRWSGPGRAQLLFIAEQDGRLELCGHGLRPGQTIRFHAGDRLLLEQSFEAGEIVVELPIQAGLNLLSITASDPASPHAMGGADDHRLLGCHLRWLRLRAETA